MLINKKLFKLTITSSLTIASGLLLLDSATTVHGETTPADTTTTEQPTPQQPTDDTTPPAGIQGKVIASGLDGSSHYYLTDQGTVYLMDGILDKTTTSRLAASSSAQTVTKIDTSLASKNSVYAPKDCSKLFNNLQKLKEFDLSNLNTSNVTDMSYMFASVHAKEGNLSNFDTSKVTNISHMFYSSSFTSLDISSFNMKSVDPYADGGRGSNPFFPSTLKQITFGPKNVFVEYVMLPTQNANGSSTYAGWQNTGTGAAASGSLKLPNNHPISEFYDGSDTKNGVETFVPYGVTETHYEPIKLTLNIYLNGKKNSLSREYDIPFVDGVSQVPSDLSFPKIFSDWKFDEDKTTLQENDDDLMTVDDIKDSGYDDIENLPQAILSELNNLQGTYDAGDTRTINMYYTGQEHPTPTPPSHNNTASHNNSTNHHDSEVPLSSQIENIATYSDKPNVELWSLNRHDSGSVTKISDRVLASNSDWYVDKKVTINGEDYLRVATNEWIKANQVYSYKDFKGSVRTNHGTYKYLYTAAGKQVGDRALSANSNWKSDRTINLNGTTYYRVATNEFVKDNDISIN